jgi:hypothetical protein
VKLIHLLVVVAFLGISASVARADGIDPIVTTKGCGGTTGTICDPVLLTGTSVEISATFPTGCLGSTCITSVTVLNGTLAAITSFTIAFNSTGTLPGGGTVQLSFACATPSEGTTFLFQCSGTGNTLTFTQGSLCPENEGETAPDGDECGVIIGLQESSTTNDPPLAGVTVSGNFSTPEPSSALLLLFGLMGGLVSFKSLRRSLA